MSLHLPLLKDSSEKELPNEFLGFLVKLLFIRTGYSTNILQDQITSSTYLVESLQCLNASVLTSNSRFAIPGLPFQTAICRLHPSLTARSKHLMLNFFHNNYSRSDKQLEADTAISPRCSFSLKSSHQASNSILYNTCYQSPHGLL